MITAVEFRDPPTEREREVWSTWLTRHGIDPCTVSAAPGELLIDDDARTITYLSVHTDSPGRAHLRSACPDGDQRRDDDPRRLICRRHITVQLEACALPLPAVAR